MADIPTVSQEIEREAHVSIQMENINIASQDIELEGVALIKIDGLQHDPVVTSTRGMLKSSSPLSSKCRIYKFPKRLRELNINIASQDIEIEDVVSSTRRMLESLSPLSSERCIYRVPKKLRKVNVEAYTPQLVSIGPFHSGVEHLQAMEEDKLRYLQTFLNRTGQSLEDCFEVVRTWEKRARGCYADIIELSSDEFVKMILVDGSFIVELLLRFYFPELRVEIDRIFDKPWMNIQVRDDLVLLENQLPFFVLEGFFNMVPVFNLEENPSFLELTYKYFNFLLNLDKFPDAVSSPKIEHFVDFIHRCCLSSFPRERHEGNATFEWPPSVTKLHEAGVKFKKGTSSCLLDIKFTNGILEIPHLMITEQTETFCRSVIAFEQCHYTKRYISDYFALLDGMISTSKDVDLLIQHGVITCMLGSSEDATTLFNNILKEGILSYKFSFSSLCEELNAYCRSPWHKWKATLKRDYFSTPWAIVSIIAAVVLLVLTFIQTVFSGIAM